MWNKIPPQQAICPSSLASRACLSHRRRPSTFSLAASTQDTPPNKWLISHGDLFSEVCPCGLFSLMRIASLPTAAGIPRFVGPSPKEEGDSKKRPYTHMTLTDIKRPQAIAVVCKYLVYQGSSGEAVSRGTLCLMTPPHPWNILKDERGCKPRVWDAVPDKEGGGTLSDWLGNRATIRHT